MTKEVMTVEEVAQYLSLSPVTIYQKVKEKSIPYTKMTNLLRFPKEVIDEWLAKNTVYPDQNLFDEFSRWHSRYLFKEWLKSKGKKIEAITDKELSELARTSLRDLQDQDA